MVNSNRSLLKYIIFNILTLGLYSIYFTYKLVNDVNLICDGDGKTTPSALKFVLLSIVTIGIYSFFWYYNLGNRLAENAPRYNLSIDESGKTVLMWFLFGAVIWAIGHWVGISIIIKNTNALGNVYNMRKAIKAS